MIRGECFGGERSGGLNGRNLIKKGRIGDFVLDLFSFRFVAFISF